VLVAQAALVVPAVRVALVVSEDPGEPAVRVALVESEDPVEPAVQVVLAGSEDPVEPAVQESPAVQELVQVVAALEHVQEEAEQALVQAAVPLRTKSVIAPHHRGLVAVPRVEDLAAEVETTREPAAAEAVIAWEVAE
jgi:hypothetical protein